MKTFKIFKLVTAIFAFTSMVAFYFGCSKDNDLQINLPDSETLASLKLAYTNASVYNDSLIICTHDSILMHNDSLNWINMIHYYDDTYHYYDSSHTTYNITCQQQLNGSHSSGHMMGGQMMGNGGQNSNYKMYSDCIEKMNALDVLHQDYHPH